jgi:hypothetical protein
MPLQRGDILGYDFNWMVVEFTMLLAACLLASAPAIAEPMGPEVAQRFVTGKLFAFNCVDGTRGLGQIYTDGSAMATIQVSGSGPARTLGFPPPKRCRICSELAAHLRDPRQGRECDRRRSRKGNRCYRRLDLCPQPVFAQSQLEARGDRSRAIAVTKLQFLVCRLDPAEQLPQRTRHAWLTTWDESPP